MRFIAVVPLVLLLVSGAHAEESQPKPMQLGEGGKSYGHLAWSADGARVSVSTRKGVHLLPAKDGAKSRMIESSSRLVCHAISSDSRLVAMGDRSGGSIRRMADPNRRLVQIDTGVRDMAFSPGGGWFAFFGSAPVVHLDQMNYDETGGHWRLQLRGSHVGSVKAGLGAAGIGHELVVGGPPEQMTFSADGTRLAVSTANGDVQLFETSTGKSLWRTRGAGRVIALAPDGKSMLIDDQMWIAGVDQPVSRFQNAHVVNAAAFAPTLSWVVTGGQDGRLMFWRPPGRLLAALDTGAGAIREVAVSPDGKRIAVLSGAMPVQVWDVEVLLAEKATPFRALDSVAERGQIFAFMEDWLLGTSRFRAGEKPTDRWLRARAAGKKLGIEFPDPPAAASLRDRLVYMGQVAPRIAKVLQARSKTASAFAGLLFQIRALIYFAYDPANEAYLKFLATIAPKARALAKQVDLPAPLLEGLLEAIEARKERQTVRSSASQLLKRIGAYVKGMSPSDKRAELDALWRAHGVAMIHENFEGIGFGGAGEWLITARAGAAFFNAQTGSLDESRLPDTWGSTSLEISAREGGSAGAHVLGRMCRHVHAGERTAVSANGALLVTYSAGSMRAWRGPSLETAFRVSFEPVLPRMPQVVVSPSGRSIAALLRRSDTTAEVVVYEGMKGRERARLPIGPDAGVQPKGRPGIYGITASDDYVVVRVPGSWRKQPDASGKPPPYLVELWNLVSRRRQGQGIPISSSSDVVTLDLGADSLLIEDRVIETSSRTEVRRLDIGAGVRSSAMSGNGKLYAVSDAKGYVSIWDRRTGQLLTRFRAALSGAEHVQFSARGNRLVTADRGLWDAPEIRVWDVEGLLSRGK